MNNDFFDKLEPNNNKQNDTKNIYQVVSIILMVLGCICSFILYVDSDDITILFIGCSISFVSGLFLYGFGEIIRQLKIANSQLRNNKNK